LSVLPKSQKANASQIKKVNLGYKYKLYPSDEQKSILEHQMFVYNQAYNICLNLWQKEQQKNKNLFKENRTYRSSVKYDSVVKRALRARKISIKTVVAQQARINFLKAVKKAFSKETISERLKAIEKAQTPKEKAKAYKLGMPAFKSSKDPYQSFNWNNQGYQLIEINNSKFLYLRLMKMPLKLRYHRELPKNYKLSSITVSRDSSGYYVSLGIEFKKEIDLVMSNNNIDITKSIGIDLNVENFAISQDIEKLFTKTYTIKDKHLIANNSKNRRALKYAKAIKVLERKQSRRSVKAKKLKTKLGANHKKTQYKLNKLNKKISNQKKDLYHKISKTLTDAFDVIVVEDLKNKNMSKSSKGNEINHGKMVKQKSGLNRSLLGASFYQFVSMIQYKQTMLNDKLFVKVNPKNTSRECICGHIDKNNRPKQAIFKCVKCGHTQNADHRASENILKKGLESLGLGISPQDLKLKAFRSETKVSVS